MFVSPEKEVRLPEHVLDKKFREPSVYVLLELHLEDKSELILLVGVPYSIPLETESDIIVTSHGMRAYQVLVRF